MSRVIAARMSEAELQERVRTLIGDFGLKAQHINDARRCWLPGFTDLEIFGNGSNLYAELKSMHGSLSRDQRDFCETVRRAGRPWVLWQPCHLLDGTRSDFRDSTIGRQLQAISGVQGKLWEASA